MGQAQLLLIVLGVVLVGIAIIAGIQAYDTNNRKASIDAMTHDIIRFASDAQIWAQKPVQFGGPSSYGLLSEADFITVGYDSVGATDWTNMNGDFAITSDDPLTVTGTNTRLNTNVIGVVCGLRDTDIFVTTGTTAPDCP